MDDIDARARKLAWDLAADAFGPGAARNAFAEDHIDMIAAALRSECAQPERDVALRGEYERGLEAAADWMRGQSLNRSAGRMLFDLRDHAADALENK